jgi:hypothetical protein
MRQSTTNKYRGALRTVARAPGPFLAIPFRARRTYLTARQCARRSLTRIRHLADKRLMHQTDIDLRFKDIRRQLNLGYFLAGAVHYWELHGECSYFLDRRPATPACARA